MSSAAARLRAALFAAFLLTVLLVWAADPVINHPPDDAIYNISEDSTLSIIISATDADGEYPLIFTHDVGGNLTRFNLTSLNTTHAILNFTPTNDEITLQEIDLHIAHIFATDISSPPFTEESYVTIYFNVTNTNDAPNVVNYTPGNLSLNTTENASLTFWYEYNTSDIDLPWGDQLNASWYVNGALNFTNGTQGGYWSHAFSLCEPAVVNITLRVWDLANANGTVNWSVNVTNVNRLPAFNASATVPNITWQEDTALVNNLSLDDHFDDPDYDECFLSGLSGDNVTFTYEVLEGVDNVTVAVNASAPHHVTFTPAGNWTGTEIIRLVMNDTNGGIAYSNNFTLNVTNLLDPPVFDAISTQYAWVDGPFMLDVNATDPDGDTLAYADNTTLFEINGTTGLINFTPAIPDIGNYSITINVTDGTFVVNASFTLFVFNNSAPALDSVDNYTVLEGATFVLGVSATDPDGDNLTFTVNRSEFTRTVVNATHSNFTWADIPDSVSNQTHPILVTVTDIGGATDSQVFYLNISGENFAPVLDAIPDIRIRANKTALFNVTASDFDNDTLEYFTNNTIVNLTRLSDTLALLNVTNGTPQLFTADVVVRESDTGVFLNDTQSILVNITDNHAPVVSIGLQNATEDNVSFINLSGFSSDEDTGLFYTETLAYAINSSFAWLTFNSTSGQIRVDVNDSADAGLYNISVNVSDDEITTQTSFILNVSEANDAPVFDEAVGNLSEWGLIFEDVTALVPAAFTTSASGPFVNATDEDGDAITFGAQFLSGPNPALFAWESVTNGRAWINFTPVQADVGNYTVNLTVTDTAGAWTGVLMNFTVHEVNDAPNISQIYPFGTPLSNSTVFAFNETDLFPNMSTDINATEGLDILFNHTSADEEGENLTVLWQLDGTNMSSNSSWVYSTGYSSNGTHNITLVVSDATNSTAFMWNLTLANVPLRPTFGHIAIDTVSDFLAGEFINMTVVAPGNLTLNRTDGQNYTFSGSYLSAAMDLVPSGRSDADYLDRYNITLINYTLSGTASGNATLEVRTGPNASNFSAWSNWTFPQLLSAGDGTVAFSATKAKHLQYRLNFTSTSAASTPGLDAIGLVYGIGNYTIAEGSSVLNWFDLDDFFTCEDPDASASYAASGYAYVSVTIDSGTHVVTLGSAIDSVNETTTTGITFTVTCGNYTLDSNPVPVTIFNQAQQSYTVIVSGGGGTAVMIEVPKLIETKKTERENLDLITPGAVIIYQNDTIIAPITLRNKGNTTLYGIKLSAASNNSAITLTYTADYFAQLLPGGEEATSLVITSYTSQGTYEIAVIANVTDPESSDSALITVNSIEKGKYSAEEVNTKIAFTRDLLSTNPQCLELNELLMRAEQSIAAGRPEEAAELLSIVLENCRYLITQSEQAAPQTRDFFDSLYSRIFGSVPSSRAGRYFGITLGVFTLLLLSLLVERLRILSFLRRKKGHITKPKAPRMQSL